VQKLVRCFVGVDMRNQHAGLESLAKECKVSLGKIKRGEHIVFVNRSRDKIKMYSHGGVLSYMKLKKGQQMNLETLKMIPDAFSEGNLELAYARSLRKIITKRI